MIVLLQENGHRHSLQSFALILLYQGLQTTGRGLIPACEYIL